MVLPWLYKSTGKNRTGVTAQALRSGDRGRSVEEHRPGMTEDGAQAPELETSQLSATHQVSVKETQT